MNVTFRLAQPEDAAGILAIYAPYCESSYVSFEIVAPAVEAMRDRIAGITSQYPWLVAEIDRELAGYVYASRHRERAAYRWAVDVAVYVAREHRRRNLGRALYTSLISILRQQGYFKALAGITLPNPGSIALHESVGFRPIATYRGVGYKMGRWLDVGWWQLDLQAEIDPPPEPISIAQMLRADSLESALAAGQRLVQ